MPSRDATDAGPRATDALLVPLAGPLHLAFPAWNAVTVRDALAAAAPAAIATTALAPGAFDDPWWRDTPEIALPQTVVPWAEARGLPVRAVGAPSPEPGAANDFARYAEGYPALRHAWQRAASVEAPLEELLAKPLGLDRLVAEVLPLVAEAQDVREEAFGDGPATDWLRERATLMADRIVAIAAEPGVVQAARPVVVLAPLDHLPRLREALADRLSIGYVPAPGVSAEARRRSLLDYAMRVDVPEPGEVIRQLRELEGPEPRYHEANLLLANGHAAEALEILEAASRMDFQHPYWLPGYLLARLGQLYDLVGRRDAAVRAYRGVRALAYAPPEARDAADHGIEAPFEPEARSGT